MVKVKACRGLATILVHINKIKNEPSSYLLILPTKMLIETLRRALAIACDESLVLMKSDVENVTLWLANACFASLVTCESVKK